MPARRQIVGLKAAAVALAADERVFGLPRDGYEVAAAQGPWVLFSYQVDGGTKVAAIVARAGPETDTEAQAGWAIETFATCDPSEYAASADSEIATRVWTDRQGNRLPTSTITSFRGHEHCDWQSVTFLHLGDGQAARQYVRDPQGVLERPGLVQPFDGNATLPGDAIDTGYVKPGARCGCRPTARSPTSWVPMARRPGQAPASSSCACSEQSGEPAPGRWGLRCSAYHRLTVGGGADHLVGPE
ncbi:MAG: hypothetical protein M3276_03825 [Actinomycetota bacterium]|nr:hypothetical protein [Actinomycetota bacterium]